MAIMYYPFQSILEKDGKRLFYPRAKVIANVGTDQIAREVAAYSSLTTGDVKNTIDNLVTVIGQHLRSSESVTLDGLGSFRMVMKSTGKGVETAKEVSAAQCTLYVRFMPSYTRNPDGSVSTRSMVTGVKCVPYKPKATEDDGSGGNGDGGGSNGDNNGNNPGGGQGEIDDNPLG
ncbi:HU family DNA-binding protein [Bacteroides sp. UBA939]|uniref:HU family DNA-binding protein n=1 Tax=Bacteroides sp. UBA939 TaxID=1946092 RepID=UPI0025BBBE76|nr:HU family DNA-binding protein [Bacteroides sp. UBA939]